MEEGGARTFCSGLLGGAQFAQARSERLGELRLDLRRDESDGIQVLDMHAVLQPVARELHPDEVGNRSEEDAFRRHVVRTHLLASEDEVDGAARAWVAGVDQHVAARGMAMDEADRSDGFDDGSEVGTIDCNVDVAGGSGRTWIADGDVEEDGEAADDAILDPGSRERLGETPDRVAKLLHVGIVCRDRQ